MSMCLRLAVPGVLSLLMAGSATAVDPGPGWYELLEWNRPFAAVHALQQSRDPSQSQELAQISAFIGDEAPACAQFGQFAFPDNAQYVDALEAVSARLADRRVVMLNESHFRSVHRAFLLRLIDALHAQGFDALAAEAFSPGASERLGTGVVDASSGFYTADPVFAAAIRRAQALGWDFVHYEASAGSSGDKHSRETGQARNLAAWLAANPGRKLLVHAGGDHISKDPEAGWMASHLIAMAGIDPLTIRQGATACPDNTDAWPVDVAHAVVPMRDGTPLPGLGDADIQVLHPPSAVQATREVLGPPVAICLQSIPQVTLLRAFAEGDDVLAIARDQRIVVAGETRGQLNLSAGRYRIEREDQGARLTLGFIEVPQKPRDKCLRPETG